MENTKLRKILVIDNDEPTLNAIIAKLDLRGFETLKAMDGQKGLSMALDYHPDLILLDIIMPKLNGLETMKKIREDLSWGKNVPIILLTNLSPDNEDIMKSINKNEPSYYLVKTNFTLDEVVDKIQEKLMV